MKCGYQLWGAGWEEGDVEYKRRSGLGVTDLQ